MGSAIDSALSGLNAASTRVDVSAGNIANAQSTQRSANGQGVKPYTARAVDQVSLSGGGSQAQVHDSGQPVDQQKELMNLNIASYDMKANMKVIKVEDDMQQQLLNIES